MINREILRLTLSSFLTLLIVLEKLGFFLTGFWLFEILIKELRLNQIYLSITTYLCSSRYLQQTMRTTVSYGVNENTILLILKK